MTMLKELYELVKPCGLDLEDDKWYRRSWRRLEEEDAERAVCDEALRKLRRLSQCVKIDVSGDDWVVIAEGNPGEVYATGKGTSQIEAMLEAVKKM